MSSGGRALAAWLKRVRNVVDHEAGKLSRVELVHSEQGGPSRVDQWRAPQILTVEVDELADEIKERVDSDAEERDGSGLEKYAVLAYYGAQSEHETSFTISRRIKGSRHRIGEGSEPATAAGALGQALRHSEKRFEGMAQAEEALHRMQREALEASHAREIALHKALEKAEEAADRGFERNMALRRQAKTDERIDRLLETVLPIVPSLLSAIPMLRGMGLEGQASGKHPLEMAMLKLFESLNEEQIHGVLNVFTREQQVAFLQVYKVLRQRAQESGGQQLTEGEEKSNAH